MNRSGAAVPRHFPRDHVRHGHFEPLAGETAVHEALKLWKQVAGLSEVTGTLRYPEILQLWFTGRCAMSIATSAVYTVLQNGPFVANTGTAIMPGSEHVWWREGKEVITCNASFCRHATEYKDGLVVNHAPAGGSFLDGAINGNVERSQQLAGYTFMTWLDERYQHARGRDQPAFLAKCFFRQFRDASSPDLQHLDAVRVARRRPFRIRFHEHCEHRTPERGDFAALADHGRIYRSIP